MSLKDNVSSLQRTRSRACKPCAFAAVTNLLRGYNSSNRPSVLISPTSAQSAGFSSLVEFDPDSQSSAAN